MPSEHGPPPPTTTTTTVATTTTAKKKSYGKQKTYGKAVRSHLGGWFGRSLWTDLEKETAAQKGDGLKKEEDEEQEDKKMAGVEETKGKEKEGGKEEAAPKKQTATTAASRNSGRPAVLQKINVVVATDEDEREQDRNIDSVVGRLGILSISDQASSVPAAAAERRASVVVSESSASSVRGGSDKENEATSAYNTPANTPRKPIVFAAAAAASRTLQDVSSPRGVLTERDPVKESPPRRRGLRKKVSALSTISATTTTMATTASATPSPLKCELSSKGLATEEGKEEAEEEENNHDHDHDHHGDHDDHDDHEEEEEGGGGAVVTEDSIRVWEDDTRDSVGRGRSFAVVIDKRVPTPPEAKEGGVEEEVRRQERSPVPETPQPESSAAVENLGRARSQPRRSADMPESLELPPSAVHDWSKAFSGPSETTQLLQLCSEPKIVDFAAHIEALLRESTVRKLGEASYSEVFLQQSDAGPPSGTVLKVIPFGKEDQCEVQSIVQEVRITKAMAEIEGFIGFRGAYVAQGQFPVPLMCEWDSYNHERGSENLRPDFYEDDQLFAIIMLENGGTDLEHSALACWQEAADVFWQVAFALARGEKAREFEHRDLHFGNIVIRRHHQSSQEEESSDSAENLLENLSLQHADEKGSNLKVAIIDYTLSRAYCGDLSGECDVEFMRLDDDALYSGKGDYQFDIYRFMRDHLSSVQALPEEESIDWTVYTPRTNVFWLHYLTNILLNKMKIPRPVVRGRNASNETEKNCHKQLGVVSRAIDPRKKRVGAVTIESAQHLLEWAVEDGVIGMGI